MPKIRRVMCFFILRYLIHVIKCEKKSSDADDFGPIPTRHETKWSQFFIIGSQNTGKQNSNGYFYQINPNQSSGHQILPFNRYTRDPTLADQEGSSMLDQRNSNAKLQNFNPRQRFQDHPHVRTFQENFQRIVPATRSNKYLNYDLQDSTQANLEREGSIATTFEYLRTTSAPLIKINNKSKKYTELSNQNIGHHKVNTESSHIFPNQQTGFQLEEKDTNFRRAPVILNEKRSSKSLPFNNSTDILRIFNFQNVHSTSPVPVNKIINRHRELSDENINHQNVKIEFTRLSQNPLEKLQLEEKDTTSRYASVILKEKKPCISFSCISNLTDFSRIKKISGRRNISQIVFTNNNSRPMVSLTAKETENEPEILFLRNVPRSSLKNANTAQNVQPVSNSNAKISLKYGTNLKFHKNDTKLEDNIQPYLATRNSHKFGSKKISSTNRNENITDNLTKTAPFQNKSPHYDFTTSASERPLTSITDLFYPRSSTVIETPEFDKLEESPNFFDPSTEPTFGQRIKSTNQFSKSNVNRGTFDQKQTTLDSSKTNNQFSPFSDKFENNVKRQQYEQSLAELNRTIFSLFWNSERLPVHKNSDALVLKNNAKLKNIKENREINSTNSEIKNDALKKSPEFQLFVNPENNGKKAKTHPTGDELYESEDNFEKINIMNHTAKEETEKHIENSNDNVDRQPQSYSFQSYRTPNLEMERENNPSQSSSLEQPADYDYHKAHSKPTDRTKYESNSPLTRYIKDSKDTVLKLKVHLLPLSKNETSGKSDSESKSETIHHLHVFTNVFEKFPPYQIQSYYAPVQQYYIPPSHYHYPKYSYIPIPHSKNQNQFTLIAPSLQEWKQHELTKSVKHVVKKEEPLTTHLDSHFTNSFPFSKNAEETEPITEAVTIPSFEDKSSRVLRTTNKKLEKVREKEESDPTAATLSSGSHNQMFHFGLSGSFKPIINIIGAKVSGEVSTEGKKFGNEYHTETGNYPTDEIPTAYSKVKNDKISTSHSLEDDLSHLVTDNATSETSDMIKSEMNSYFATKISTIAKQQNDLLRNLSSSNKIAAFQFMYPKYMNSTIFTNKLPVTNTTTSSLHYTSTMNPEETLLSFGIRSPQANIQKRNKTELPFLERAINLFENVIQLHNSSVPEMININQTKCAHNTFLSTTNDNSTNPTHLRKKELELAEYNSSTLNSQSIVNVIRNESHEIRCMRDTAADAENSTLHDDIEQSINETNKMFKITSPIENIQDEIEFAATTPMNAFQKDAEFTTRADEITLFMTTTFPDDYSETQENIVNKAPAINATVLLDESMFNYNNGTDLNEAYIIINSTEYILLENASNYVTASTYTETLNMQLDNTGIHPYRENKSIEKINETEYPSNFAKKSNVVNENLFKQTTGIEHSEIEDVEFRSKALKDFSSSERIIVTNKTEQKESIHDNRTAQETDTLNISVDINTNRNQSFTNTSLDQLKNSSPKTILEISKDKNPATERDEISSKIKNDYFLEKNDSTHTIEKDKHIKSEMMNSLTKLTERLISSENSSIEISKAITNVKSQNISNFKDPQKGAKKVDSKIFINLFSNLPTVQNTGATEAYELLTEPNTLATSASDSTNKSEKVSSYSSTDSYDNSKNEKDLLVP